MPINPYSLNTIIPGGEPNGGLTLGGTSLAYDMLNENLLTAANINLMRGNLDIGAEYSGLHSTERDSHGVLVGNPSRSFLGATGGLNFGTYAGSRKGDWENRFMGILSGKLGYGGAGTGLDRYNLEPLQESDKGLAYSGRLDLKSGRPGRTYCVGSYCSAAPVPSRSIGLFGEYGNPYSLNPGLRVGAEGHFRFLSGGGGYDFESQSPFINAGLRIPIR